MLHEPGRRRWRASSQCREVVGSPGLERIDFQVFDPLLSEAQAEAMLRLCERFGSYGTYAEEAIEDDFAEGLAQRIDAALNFVRTGGRFGRKESVAKLAARTNYFRETYAYDQPLVPGIEPFLQHEGFIEAARRVHGRPLIRPNIVYANLLVPGQELAVHTDVPEFRGVSRKRDPQWLIVAMHHSRLFERWRMPIATGVAWFGEPEGGEFVFYPEGPFGPPVALAPRHNTAILLDTDTVFHGVDRVAESRVPMPDLKPGMRLVLRWLRQLDADQRGPGAGPLPLPRSALLDLLEGLLLRGRSRRGAGARAPRRPHARRGCSRC